MGQNLRRTVSQDIRKITTTSGVGKKRATSQQHVALPERFSVSPPAAPMVLSFQKTFLFHTRQNCWVEQFQQKMVSFLI